MPIRFTESEQGIIKIDYDYLDNEKPNSLTIEIDYDEILALKKFKHFVLQGRVPNINFHKYNKYECKSLDIAIESFNTFLELNEFYYNNVERIESELRFHEKRTPNNYNKLFIMQMSKKYEAFPPRDLPIKYYFEDCEFYDLIDPINRIVFKCKYSKSKVNMSKDFRWAEENIPEGYTLKIIVNDTAEIAKTVTVDVTRETFIEPIIEDVPRDQIDAAIEEAELISGRLIADNEFDMRVELCNNSEHDMEYGLNHISEHHILTNRSRQVIEAYIHSNYFQHVLDHYTNAKRLIEAIYD